MKYTVYFDEWEDGHGWRCCSPIDTLTPDTVCTAEFYIDMMDEDVKASMPEGKIVITAYNENTDEETVVSEAWLKED